MRYSPTKRKGIENDSKSLARLHNKHVTTFSIDFEATDYTKLNHMTNGNDEADFEGFNMNSE